MGKFSSAVTVAIGEAQFQENNLKVEHPENTRATRFCPPLRSLCQAVSTRELRGASIMSPNIKFFENRSGAPRNFSEVG